MAIQISAKKELQDYILKEDRASERPTVFTYKRLSHQDKKKLADMAKLSPKQAKVISDVNDACKKEKREMTEEEQQRVVKVMGKNATMEFLLKQAKYTVGCALKKITTVYDPKTKKWKPSMKVEDFMKVKSNSIFFELSRAINEFTDMGEVEIKN